MAEVKEIKTEEKKIEPKNEAPRVVRVSLNNEKSVITPSKPAVTPVIKTTSSPKVVLTETSSQVSASPQTGEPARADGKFPARPVRADGRFPGRPGSRGGSRPFQRQPRGGRSFRGKPGERRSGGFSDLDRRVISIRRVAKVNAGSKRLRFSAVVVSGDRKGKVAIGLGRGADTRLAVEKAAKYAASHLVKVDLLGDTVPHEVQAKFRAAKVFIKPAGPGTGVIASSSVRSVMEMAGVRNVLTKQLGSNNSIVNAYCTLEALKMLNKTRILERRSQILKTKLNQKKIKKDDTKQTKKTKK